jgi:hypothetical protein
MLKMEREVVEKLYDNDDPNYEERGVNPVLLKNIPINAFVHKSDLIDGLTQDVPVWVYRYRHSLFASQQTGEKRNGANEYRLGSNTVQQCNTVQQIPRIPPENAFGRQTSL